MRPLLLPQHVAHTALTQQTDGLGDGLTNTPLPCCCHHRRCSQEAPPARRWRQWRPSPPHAHRRLLGHALVPGGRRALGLTWRWGRGRVGGGQVQHDLWHFCSFFIFCFLAIKFRTLLLSWKRLMSSREELHFSETSLPLLGIKRGWEGEALSLSRLLSGATLRLDTLFLPKPRLPALAAHFPLFNLIFNFF